MVVYSAFIAASMLSFLHISTRFVFDGDEWDERVQANVVCLAEKQLLGLDAECSLDLNIGDNVYWMQGMVLLSSSASFVLIFSKQRWATTNACASAPGTRLSSGRQAALDGQLGGFLQAMRSCRIAQLLRLLPNISHTDSEYRAHMQIYSYDTGVLL